MIALSSNDIALCSYDTPPLPAFPAQPSSLWRHHRIAHAVSLAARFPLRSIAPTLPQFVLCARDRLAVMRRYAVRASTEMVELEPIRHFSNALAIHDDVRLHGRLTSPHERTAIALVCAARPQIAAVDAVDGPRVDHSTRSHRQRRHDHRSRVSVTRPAALSIARTTVLIRDHRVQSLSLCRTVNARLSRHVARRISPVLLFQTYVSPRVKLILSLTSTPPSPLSALAAVRSSHTRTTSRVRTPSRDSAARLAARSSRPVRC